MAETERSTYRWNAATQHGFTLIEVLIVILILAVLGAVVVFAVQDMSGKTAVATCQSDYKTLENSAELFKAQVGDYPQGTGYFSGVTVTAHAGVGGTANDQTILDLMGTATVTGDTVGPWIKDYPVDGSYFQLELMPTGAIGVYTSGATPTEIGSTDSAADCTGLG